MGGLPSESKVTRCTSATVAGQPTAGEHPRRPVPDHERRRGGDLAHLRPGAISRSPTAPRVVPTPAATPPLQHLRSALNAGPFSGEPRPRSIVSRQRPPLAVSSCGVVHCLGHRSTGSAMSTLSLGANFAGLCGGWCVR